MEKSNFFSDLCDHKNQILDEHEGSYICLDCAKVLDNFFCQSNLKTDNEFKDFYQNEKGMTSELTHRLNIPDLNLKNEKTDLKCASNIYLEANKKNYSVTLKEISSVSGCSLKKISKDTKNTVNILDISTLLEKYCKLLNLDFKTYAVIKESLNHTKPTGHNPITIVTSHIYSYIK